MNLNTGCSNKFNTLTADVECFAIIGRIQRYNSYVDPQLYLSYLKKIDLDVYRNATIPKSLLPKGPVSEHPAAVNVLTGPQNCWNLQESNFIPLFHDFELEKFFFN